VPVPTLGGHRWQPLATLPFRAGLAGPDALREAVAGFWRTYAKRRGELIGIFQS